MSQGNKTVIAVYIMALKGMDNDTLAAANNALNGFGQIMSGNQAYGPMKEAGLILEDGTPEASELLDALSFEVNRRVKDGTFV